MATTLANAASAPETTGSTSIVQAYAAAAGPQQSTTSPSSPQTSSHFTYAPGAASNANTPTQADIPSTQSTQSTSGRTTTLTLFTTIFPKAQTTSPAGQDSSGPTAITHTTSNATRASSAPGTTTTSSSPLVSNTPTLPDSDGEPPPTAPTHPPNTSVTPSSPAISGGPTLTDPVSTATTLGPTTSSPETRSIDPPSPTTPPEGSQNPGPQPPSSPEDQATLPPAPDPPPDIIQSDHSGTATTTAPANAADPDSTTGRASSSTQPPALPAIVTQRPRRSATTAPQGITIVPLDLGSVLDSKGVTVTVTTTEIEAGMTRTVTGAVAEGTVTA